MGEHPGSLVLRRGPRAARGRQEGEEDGEEDEEDAAEMIQTVTAKKERSGEKQTLKKTLIGGTQYQTNVIGKKKLDHVIGDLKCGNEAIENEAVTQIYSDNQNSRRN